MKKHMIVATAILASGLGVAGISNALAEAENTNSDKVEANALRDAKLSATDAAAAALKSVPGKVSEIGFDAENGDATYEVTVVATDGGEHNLMVNAQSGAVTKVAAGEDKKGDEQDSDGDESGEN